MPIEINATTGSEFEREVLKRAATYRGKIRFRNFQDSFDESLRQDSKWNPSDPPTPVAKKLYAEIYQNLRVEIQDKLKILVTTNTPLDLIHGVDALVYIDIYTFVTIDLSIIPHPSKTPKADILLTKESIESGRIPELGMAIACKLNKTTLLRESLSSTI